MTTKRSLRWSHLTPDSVEQWAELTNLLAMADRTEEYYEAEDLAEELEEFGFTPETDSWAVWDGELMVGYGQLRVAHNLDDEGRVRCQLGGGVHPDWRGRGIGRELVRRQEERGRELAAERHSGTPYYFRAGGELEGSDARRLLTHMGYAVVRYFNELARPLPGDPVTVPDPAELDGVELLTPTSEHEGGVREAHNAAFVDHWGSTPQSEATWHDYWTGRPPRRQLSTLAIGDDGAVLAYVLVSQWVPRQAYVDLVGTVREARGRGLAAACLSRSIRLAAESGQYDVIELGVDSDSPTGATRLYERLGFRLDRVMAAMMKEPVVNESVAEEPSAQG